MIAKCCRQQAVREGGMRLKSMVFGVALAVALGACTPAAPPAPQAAAPAAGDFSGLVAEPQTVEQVLADLASGRTTSEKLVQAYLDRIARVDDAGPMLNAVIATNPNALADARASDARRAAGTIGALEGVPILLKDNIETLDPMPTTAGSLALKNNLAGRDAPVAARLRAAGAIIIGKANLSEWANFRSDYSSSGWSGVGGLTRNPHVLDRNPCGSSSGSGAGMAAGLAAATVGTETDGSVVCPSGANGIVGIKPTVGLVSRTHIVPISASQDTAGPMTLTVSDAARMLAVMAGSDPADPATAEADARKADYMAALDANALRGKRIGVLRYLAGYHPQTDAVFEQALQAMKDAGAELVDITEFANRRAAGAAEGIVLKSEFRAGIDAYLASTSPERVQVRSLADLIAFNKATPEEMRWFGQNTLEESAAAPALTDRAYLTAKAAARRLAGPEGIDRMLAEHRLDALVAPTGGPAWVSDLVTGDHFLGSSSSLAAISGYPNITVPMGAVDGLPLGVSFIGPAWSEARIIGLAYAYEQKAHARITPNFRAHAP
jgi:amidase